MSDRIENGCYEKDAPVSAEVYMSDLPSCVFSNVIAEHYALFLLMKPPSSLAASHNTLLVAKIKFHQNQLLGVVFVKRRWPSQFPSGKRFPSQNL